MKILPIIPAYTNVDRRAASVLGRLGLDPMVQYESSDLVKCRSMLLSIGLLKSDADAFLLVDSDTIPKSEHIEEMAQSKHLNEHCALTGVYMLKSGRFSVNPIGDSSKLRMGSDTYVKCISAGLGFCMITRKSLERLAETLPQLEEDGNKWWPFCLPVVENGTYYPEDGVLWKRLRETRTGLKANLKWLAGHVIARPVEIQPDK